MFTKIQDQAIIRRPDFKKMVHESIARIETKKKVIKHQEEMIIKFKNELTQGNSTHQSCTHKVKST
jgi:glutamine amidotransferase PdxT